MKRLSVSSSVRAFALSGAPFCPSGPAARPDLPPLLPQRRAGLPGQPVAARRRVRRQQHQPAGRSFSRENDLGRGGRRANAPGHADRPPRHRPQLVSVWISSDASSNVYWQYCCVVGVHGCRRLFACMFCVSRSSENDVRAPQAFEQGVGRAAAARADLYESPAAVSGAWQSLKNCGASACFNESVHVLERALVHFPGRNAFSLVPLMMQRNPAAQLTMLLCVIKGFAP